MNNISLMGRLTADPELKQTTNGVSVCSFTVAVPRPHVKETTDFIRCVAWRKTAEFLDTYFVKGKMIAITGILTSRSWKDENNKSHSVNEVMVETIDFCGDKQNQQSNPQADTTTGVPEGLEEIDEDLPF